MLALWTPSSLHVHASEGIWTTTYSEAQACLNLLNSSRPDNFILLTEHGLVLIHGVVTVVGEATSVRGPDLCLVAIEDPGNFLLDISACFSCVSGKE